MKWEPKLSIGLGVGLVLAFFAISKWSRPSSTSPASFSSTAVTPAETGPGKASTRWKRGSNEMVSSKVAAAEIRRLCFFRQKDPGRFDDLQYLYDQGRVVKLVECLDLADVEALLADPELIAASKSKDLPQLAAAAMSWLEKRRARLLPGEYLSSTLLDARRADGFYTVFKYRGLLSAAAQGDPDAAIAFWNSYLSTYEPENPDVPLPSYGYLADLIDGLTMASPAKAWEFIGGLDASTKTPDVIQHYFSALPAGTDWSLAVSQVESCGPLLRGDRLADPALGLAMAWMKDDPDGATRWLDSINDSLIEFRETPNAMATGNARLESRASVYASAMDEWLMADPLEAIEFLDRWQPADASKVQVLRDMMSNSSPAMHPRLIEMLDSPEERAELVLAVAHDSNERADIDRLLSVDGLSPETREALKGIQGSLSR